MARVISGRVFAAIVPPPEIALAIEDRLTAVAIPGRPVPTENLHITLRFFGTMSRLEFEKLTAVLDGGIGPNPLTIRLTGLGAFPNSVRATVLWLDVMSSHLNGLAGQVETAVQAAGFTPEERPYRAHMTLARIRPPEDVRALVAGAAPLDLRWKATSFHLMATGGPRYRRLETFPLA